MTEQLLENGSFEGEYYYPPGLATVHLARGWQHWYDENDVMPEYKRAERGGPGPTRVHEGEAAQQWFNTHATHTAGVWQPVENLIPGAILTFSAWVMCWSSGQSDPDISDGRYRMKIGIDPYGGEDPESGDIVWSNEGHAIQPHNQWEQLTVEAPARSDRCTVYVWGQPEWPLRNNNGYVDTCELTEEIPGPGPGPGPGFTEEQIREFARQEAQAVLVEAVEAWYTMLTSSGGGL